MSNVTSTTLTIGCDLSDKFSVLFLLHGDGRTEHQRLRTNREALAKYFATLTDHAHVVIEVGPHSRWVAQLLSRLGHQVTVANPRRLKVISTSDSKDDWRDAELLARLGRADLSLLSPVTHRDDQAQSELSVLKSRDALVKTRTKLVNFVRSAVKTSGERLPTCSAASFHRRTGLLVPEALRPALDPIYAVLEALSVQIRELDRTIEGIAAKDPEIDVVTQIDGVGILTAVAFMRTVGDKHRFRRSRTVGAFLGLRPRRSQSGNDDPQLRITKAGDGFVRCLLVSAANYILGPFGKDTDLRRWGLRLAERGGKNARKRAKVAVARKLAVLMHRLWVTGEEYEPVRTERLAA
jgi:transposase